MLSLCDQMLQQEAAQSGYGECAGRVASVDKLNAVRIEAPALAFEVHDCVMAHHQGAYIAAPAHGEGLFEIQNPPQVVWMCRACGAKQALERAGHEDFVERRAGP